MIVSESEELCIDYDMSGETDNESGGEVTITSVDCVCDIILFILKYSKSCCSKRLGYEGLRLEY